jgi:hypothetical protein
VSCHAATSLRLDSIGRLWTACAAG